MKPGILILLVFEAITAMVVTSGPSIKFANLASLAVSGALASGGSAALNQYLERGRDAMMARTDSRPVATSRISPINALVFGIVTISLGLLISYFALNPVTALMILIGALSYVMLYTMYLKPRTKWNIVIGGIAGVFPALAGSAAVTGFVSWPGLFIGSLVFLWTPPHFWGLSMKYREDYEKTGFPMLSVVKTETQVIHWIVYSSIPLFVFSLLPYSFHVLGSFSPEYYVVAGILALIFIVTDIQMWVHPSVKTGFRAFLVSLPYLFVLFAAMIAFTIA